MAGTPDTPCNQRSTAESTMEFAYTDSLTVKGTSSGGESKETVV